MPTDPPWLNGERNDEKPLVSVVLPAHNAAATIAETLASALGQSYRNLEVIVIDDASTDDTAAIARRAGAEDPRVRVVELPRNSGPSGARNAGIAQARGTYVALLDADDLWRPDKIAKQVERFRSAPPSVGVVYCWWTYMDGDGITLPGRYGAYLHEGDVYARMLMATFIGPASVPMIRRDLLLAVGGFDESLPGHEDKALYMALAEVSDYAVVPECLVGYRAVPGSFSHGLENLIRGDRMVHAEARQRHPELPGWLFRWADANFTWWAAFRYLHHGRRGTALRTAARVFATDPAFLLRPTAYGVFGGVLRRLAGRQRPPDRGVPFLRSEPIALVPTQPQGRFERWRDQCIGRLRIDRILLSDSAGDTAVILRHPKAPHAA
jgi:glycosyltransferase involved in cell wall biosynthesis